MDADGYPDENDLERIRNWDGLHDPMGLIRFVGELWHYKDWGFILDESEDPIRLELHTGGWSGNESVIEVLRSNEIGGIGFWYIFWQESRRGGHHKFEIPRSFLGKR